MVLFAETEPRPEIVDLYGAEVQEVFSLVNRLFHVGYQENEVKNDTIKLTLVLDRKHDKQTTFVESLKRELSKLGFSYDQGYDNGNGTSLEITLKKPAKGVEKVKIFIKEE